MRDAGTGGGVSVDMPAPKGDGGSQGGCPNGITFADINSDFDAQGCTNGLMVCHGPTNPKGRVSYKPNGQTDMTVLMANYAVAKSESNLANPPQSNLLLYPLVPVADAGTGGGITHDGGKFDDANMTLYKKWLSWIELGAQLGCVPLSNLKSDMGSTTMPDMSIPTDMAKGGG